MILQLVTFKIKLGKADRCPKNFSMAKVYSLVKVIWEDAHCKDDTTWVHMDEEVSYDPLIMATTGFLLYDGKEGVIVTNTVSESVCAPRDQIPRGMIRSIEELSKVEI